jgi:hypothetical protein
MSLAIFISGTASRTQPGRGADQGVEAGLGRELVRRGDEREAGLRGDLGGDLLGEPRRGVEAGADRGAPGGEFVEPLGRSAHPVDRLGQLMGVARPLLADGQRDGVLQVGAPDLDHVSPLLRLGCDRVPQRLDRREQTLVDRLDGGDVHRGGERVVRGLTEVHVVVGMHRLLAAELPADQLDRAVADHLVDVHVGLRAGAGLPDVQREVLVQLPGDHLVGDPLDQLGLPSRQPSGAAVDDRGGLLDLAVGVVDGLGHPVVADGEVDERPLGLRAPVLVGGHLDLAHRIGLDPRPLDRQADRRVEQLRPAVVALGRLCAAGHDCGSSSW